MALIAQDVGMVKHTAPDATRTLHRRWPPEPKGTGLFVPRAPLRQLVAMVDAHLIEDASPAPAGADAEPPAGGLDGRRRAHLRALLSHPTRLVPPGCVTEG